MSRIEDYALIGSCTAALVDRRGSIDWLCFRASTPACFAALLGDEATAAGCSHPSPTARRPPLPPRHPRPRDDAETTTGVRVLDFMPARRVARRRRIVEGARSAHALRARDPLRLRAHRPLSATSTARGSVAGADVYSARRPHRGRHADVLGDVVDGRACPFTWYRRTRIRRQIDPSARRHGELLARVERQRMRLPTSGGTWSLADVVLKALTYAPTAASPHRRRRCRRHRQRPQLGLSLLLAARCDATLSRAQRRHADEARSGGAGCSRCRRRSGRPRDLYVAGERQLGSSSCRGCPATRAGTGPRRQRGERAAADRRLRRGDGRLYQARTGARREAGLGAPAGPARVPRRVAEADSASGDPRRAAALVH
jgi:hypothetical protein